MILSKYPYNIARLLGKSNEEASRYTGHCWRRTAVTLAANNGASTSDLQLLRGWVSQRVVNRYTGNSDLRRAETARLVSLASPILPQNPTLLENQHPTVFNISIQVSPTGVTTAGAGQVGVIVPPVPPPVPAFDEIDT